MKAKLVGALLLLAILVASPVHAEDKSKLYTEVLPSIVKIGVTFDNKTIVVVGTGVIVGKNGYVLTARHNLSIDGAKRYFVLLYDTTQIPAETIYLDGVEDLAIMQLPANRDYTPIKIDFNRKAHPGESASVVSHALVGTVIHPCPSIYSGYIANTDVKLPPDTKDGSAIEGVLQLDIFIAPGSSGGAVVSDDGYLLGISYMIIAETSEVSKIQHKMYFAIPLEKAKALIESTVK